MTKAGLTVCLCPVQAAPVVDVARVPQGERSRATRARLLEATIACLVERGWTGTSTTLVSDRAGVSRGAQLHHFPTKNDLVLAAIDHLTTLRADEVTREDELPPQGTARTRRVLEQLAALFTGPTFSAALELWVAARTDPTLRDAVIDLESRLGRDAHRRTVDALGIDESVPGNRELVQATLDLVRGLGLASTLSDDAARRGRILDRWAEVLDAGLVRTAGGVA
jgi:AcrR family transcriptional regulator